MEHTHELNMLEESSVPANFIRNKKLWQKYQNILVVTTPLKQTTAVGGCEEGPSTSSIPGRTKFRTSSPPKQKKE